MSIAKENQRFNSVFSIKHGKHFHGFSEATKTYLVEQIEGFQTQIDTLLPDGLTLQKYDTLSTECSAYNYVLFHGNLAGPDTRPHIFIGNQAKEMPDAVIDYLEDNDKSMDHLLTCVRMKIRQHTEEMAKYLQDHTVAALIKEWDWLMARLEMVETELKQTT